MILHNEEIGDLDGDPLLDAEIVAFMEAVLALKNADILAFDLGKLSVLEDGVDASAICRSGVTIWQGLNFFFGMTKLLSKTISNNSLGTK